MLPSRSDHLQAKQGEVGRKGTVQKELKGGYWAETESGIGETWTWWKLFNRSEGAFSFVWCLIYGVMYGHAW